MKLLPKCIRFAEANFLILTNSFSLITFMPNNFPEDDPKMSTRQDNGCIEGKTTPHDPGMELKLT